MTRKTKNIIKIVLGVITLIVVAVAIIMVNNNPNRKSEHMKVLSQVVDKFDPTKLNLTEAEQVQYEGVIMMGSGSSSNIMNKLVSPVFDVKSNGLWTVGYVHDRDWNFKRKVTTGYLNKIKVVDEQELMQAILEAHRSNAKAASNAVPPNQQQQGSPQQ